MNRYRGAWTSSASSKASPSTTCQKCLKKGHYSYECKAPQAERPYISRPSRTQQLLNPNARQKLTMAAPPDEKKDHDMLRKEGIADEILAQKAKERKETKKRRRDSVSPSPPPRRSRSQRSPSISSVSSYSTASSARSVTPPRRSHSRKTRSRSPDRRVRRRYRESPSPVHGRGRRLDQEEQRRRSTSRSNDARDRRTPLPPSHPRHSPKAPRERSLSPFSRRLALTKAIAHDS